MFPAELDESEPFVGEATVVFDTPKARLNRRCRPVEARLIQPESRTFYRSEGKVEWGNWSGERGMRSAIWMGRYGPRALFAYQLSLIHI